MFLSLLQFFATKFLFLALHLESGSFPRPLSPQEEIKTFSALREGDPSAREKLIHRHHRPDEGRGHLRLHPPGQIFDLRQPMH